VSTAIVRANAAGDRIPSEISLPHRGWLHLYQRSGLDLRIVMPRNGRIELTDMERAIDRNTRLVEVPSCRCTTAFNTISERCAGWRTRTVHSCMRISFRV
jgi:hypothetical protein